MSSGTQTPSTRIGFAAEWPTWKINEILSYGRMFWLVLYHLRGLLAWQLRLVPNNFVVGGGGWLWLKNYRISWSGTENARKAWSRVWTLCVAQNLVKVTILVLIPCLECVGCEYRLFKQNERFWSSRAVCGSVIVLQGLSQLLEQNESFSHRHTVEKGKGCGHENH